jgi:hypothetical protein
VRWTVRSLFLVREGRKKRVRLLKETDDKIQIRIVSASRDAKTQKMTYETVETLDVVEAKPEEVVAAIRKMLSGK